MMMTIEDLVKILKKQSWSNLINWNFTNMEERTLWIYDNYSKMVDAEAIIISNQEDYYSIADIKLNIPDSTTNNKNVIFKIKKLLELRQNILNK